MLRKSELVPKEDIELLFEEVADNFYTVKEFPAGVGKKQEIL